MSPDGISVGAITYNAALILPQCGFPGCFLFVSRCCNSVHPRKGLSLVDRGHCESQRAYVAPTLSPCMRKAYDVLCGVEQTIVLDVKVRIRLRTTS